METDSTRADFSKKPPGRKRDAATTQAIIAAARALLHETGYANFTIEEVSRRSGASKSTIYRWWKSKMHLLLELYDGDIETMLEMPDSGNVESEIAFFIRAIWKLWRETPSGQAYKSMIAEVQADPSAFAQWRSKFLSDRRVKLVCILQRAAGRAELSPEANLEIAVDLICGFCWYRQLTAQIDDDVDAIAAMVRTIVRGIT